MRFFTFENFASRAADATRRDKAWDRAGKPRLVMRIRTILVAVLISPYLSQKVAGLGVRVSAGSTLEEPLIGLEVQKSTLEWCETAVSPLRNSHPYDRRHDRHPP